MRLKKLNEKEKKGLIDYLSEVYGIDKEIFTDFVFFEHNERIYILKKEAYKFFKEIDVPFYALGFYLCKKERKDFRLSFDATQLFGRWIKNYIEINEDEAYKWFKGEDLEIENIEIEKNKIESEIEIESEEENREKAKLIKIENRKIEENVKKIDKNKKFVVLKFKKDFVGCGLIKIENLDGKSLVIIKNFVPKERRI